MGYNTTIMLINDALDQIETDPMFAKNLVRGCQQVIRGEPITISAGNHGNAAMVIETHHADGTSLVAVGQNYGQSLGLFYPYGDQSFEVKMLRQLAEKYGYYITKKK